MDAKTIFLLPNQNDIESIRRHKRAVFHTFAKVFQDVDDALAEALPKVKNTFDLWGGPVDLAVHAPNTRYLVKQHLTKRSKEVIEENDVCFDMQRVSNCGLCVKTPLG